MELKGLERKAAIALAPLVFPCLGVAGIPASWNGELIIEQQLPRFSPAPQGTLAATAATTVPFRKTLMGIEGGGKSSIRQDLQFPGCTGTSDGTWEYAITGNLATPLQSVAGQALRLTITRKAASITHTINCERSFSVNQPLPETKGDVEIPLADGAGPRTLTAVGRGTLTSSLKLKLPCQWDTRLPPGPKVVFRPDPRTDQLYPGPIDGTHGRTELTQTHLRNLLGDNVPASLKNVSSVRGITEAPRWFITPDTPEIYARNVQVGEGSCIWAEELTFSLPPLRQFVASEVWQRAASECRHLVIAHEDEHRDATVRLLRDAANQLERSLQRVSGPHDAELGDDALTGKEQLRLRIRSVIADAETAYAAASMRAHSAIDASSSAAGRELQARCSAEGL